MQQQVQEAEIKLIKAISRALFPNQVTKSVFWYQAVSIPSIFQGFLSQVAGLTLLFQLLSFPLTCRLFCSSAQPDSTLSSAQKLRFPRSPSNLR